MQTLVVMMLSTRHHLLHAQLLDLRAAIRPVAANSGRASFLQEQTKIIRTIDQY
jgi:hypothetical protein